MLLMGGQACVFYGAAQVSKDVDLLVLAESANFARLELALNSIPDLVLAEKTQRSKDWPVIELLVAIHHRGNAAEPTAAHIAFWLREARTPELLCRLAAEFPRETAAAISARPLLTLARAGEIESLRGALDVELRAEQARDREHWEPLRRELEHFRRAERMD